LKYHPDRDQTNRAAAKMAEINRAYAMLRDEATRLAFDRNRRSRVGGISGQTIVPPPAASSRASTGSSVLQFGRYAGWTLHDLARRDTDYLLWLSRHSSGIRYRAEIYALLSAMGIKANT
jgi:DnaJ-class molecular chaperone